MKEEKVYKVLANKVQTYINNKDKDDGRYEKDVRSTVENCMPKGSGFNLGTDIDLEKSNRNKLVFYSTFEYMNDVGMYAGAIDFKIIVTPNLLFDFDLEVKGPFNKLPRYCFDLKGYIEDTFIYCLKDTTEM